MTTKPRIDITTVGNVPPTKHFIYYDPQREVWVAYFMKLPSRQDKHNPRNAMLSEKQEKWNRWIPEDLPAIIVEKPDPEE